MLAILGEEEAVRAQSGSLQSFFRSRTMRSAPDPAPGPERRLVSSDLLDRVTEAMDELPEHYRIVIWLRDGEDLSYAEIAEALDLPIGTVRSRLARARSALKKAVGL